MMASADDSKTPRHQIQSNVTNVSNMPNVQNVLNISSVSTVSTVSPVSNVNISNNSNTRMCRNNKIDCLINNCYCLSQNIVQNVSTQNRILDSVNQGSAYDDNSDIIIQGQHANDGSDEEKLSYEQTKHLAHTSKSDYLSSNSSDISIDLEGTNRCRNNEKLISLTWNIRGFTSDRRIVQATKYETLNHIISVYAPDIINIVEGRVHYEQKQDQQTRPIDLDGYFNNIMGTYLCDNNMKTVTYYNTIHAGRVRKLVLNTHKSTNVLEHHHWATWTILCAGRDSKFTEDIINGCYYRSNRVKEGVTNEDIAYLGQDLIEIKSIYNHRRVQRVIISGDFNIKDPNIAMTNRTVFNRHDVNEYKLLQQIMDKHDLAVINTKDVPTHWYMDQNVSKCSVLDLCIVSKKLRTPSTLWRVFARTPKPGLSLITGNEAVRRYGSDHVPIITIIGDESLINTSYSMSASKTWQNIHKLNFNWRKPRDLLRYRHGIKTDLTRWVQKYQHIHNGSHALVDQCGYELRLHLHSNCKNYIGLEEHQGTRLRKVWSDDEVVRIARVKLGLVKKLNKGRGNTRHIRQKLQRVIAEENELIMNKKCENIMKRARSMHTKGNQIWDHFRYLKNYGLNRNRHIPFLVNKNRILTRYADNARIYDDTDKANALNIKFCHQQNTDIRYTPYKYMNLKNIPTLPLDIYPKNDLDICEYIKNPSLHSNYKTEYTYVTELQRMNGDFTLIEIKTAFRALKIAVNHGIGVNTRVIKPIRHMALPVILRFLNICWNSGHLSNVYKLRQILPQCKPGKDPNTISVYRQISLFGCIRKLLEWMLKKRITAYILRMNLVDKHSMAAFKGKAGLDAVTLFLDSIRNKLQNNIPTFAIYMDVASCYPSQHFDIMMHRLKHYYGITGKMYDILFDLFVNNWTQTIVNGHGSEWLVSLQGQDQGQLLSQLLNLLFLDPLNHVIERKHTFKLISFVDDYLLYSNLLYFDHTNLELMVQEEIDHINTWLNRNRMRNKVEKVKSITYLNKKLQKLLSCDKIEIITYMNDILDGVTKTTRVVSESTHIKYLGHTMGHDLSVTVTINAVIKRTNIAYHLVKQVLRRTKHINAYAMNKIITATVLGTMGYDIMYVAIATKEQLKPLIVVWNRVLRLMTGLKHTTTVEHVYFLSQMGTLTNWIHLKNARYFIRLLHLPMNNPLRGVIEGENGWYNIWKKDLLRQKQKIYRETQRKKSPLWTTYISAKSLGVTQDLNMIKYANITYHEPVFNGSECLPPIPSNMVFIDHPFSADQKDNMFMDRLYVYTDGSIKSKIGGIGIYIAKHTRINVDNTEFIPEDISMIELALGLQNDINYVEGHAINFSLKEIIRARHYEGVCDMLIVTDNKNVFNWLRQESALKDVYNYKQICDIYKRVTHLGQRGGFMIAIQWCQRGVWEGNKIADELAKSAVDNYLRSNYEFNVVLERSSLRHLKNIAKKRWGNLNRMSYVPYKSSHVISTNLFDWNRYGDEYPWKLDMTCMNMEGFAILNRLRTEHIGLNWYFHSLRHYPYYKQQLQNYGFIRTYLKCQSQCCTKNNNGFCTSCDEKETVYHYLIECTKYDHLRNNFLYCIEDIFMMYDINLTLENILFPPKALSWHHRKMILDSLYGFVKSTKRIFIYF